MSFDDVAEVPDQEFEFEKEQVYDTPPGSQGGEEEEEEPVGTKSHALKPTKFRTLTHLTVSTTPLLVFASSFS